MANILIVDDDLPFRKIIEEMLQTNEVTCSSASNAGDARKALKDQKIDLVMADIDLPGESGLDLSQFVLSKYADTAVIIMTGIDDAELGKHALDIGAYGYIAKPIEKNSLLFCVNSALKRARLERENRQYRENLESLVAEQTAELRRSDRRFRELIEDSIQGILIHRNHKPLFVNQTWASIHGYTIDEIYQMESVVPLMSQKDQKRMVEYKKARLRGEYAPTNYEYQGIRSDGTSVWLENRVMQVRWDGDMAIMTIIIDITERKILEAQLLQAQKLESIGQLAAGISHEINTPIQYVGYNTQFFKEQFEHLDPLFDQHQELLQAARAGKVPDDLLIRAESALEALDLPFIREEIPPALDQTIEGVEHVSKIVRAMKEFSHPGTDDKAQIDLNQAIESTVVVARNEWKYVAEVTTELDPDLPLVPCLPADLNQVILNMIVNAAHAIGEVVDQGSEKGTISISTRRQNGWAEIRIKDTGTGIAEKHRSRIFDPFFTTKEVGKGTGQGLAISHSIIADKHSGTLNFETETGKGTTFVIRLPIEPQVN